MTTTVKLPRVPQPHRVLTRLIEWAGNSQSDLSRALGLSPVTVGQWMFRGHLSQLAALQLHAVGVMPLSLSAPDIKQLLPEALHGRYVISRLDVPYMGRPFERAPREWVDRAKAASSVF